MVRSRGRSSWRKINATTQTCAEQGEDMQGYVTELILTLEAVVETLDSGQ